MVTSTTLRPAAPWATPCSSRPCGSDCTYDANASACARSSKVTKLDRLGVVRAAAPVGRHEARRRLHGRDDLLDEHVLLLGRLPASIRQLPPLRTCRSPLDTHSTSELALVNLTSKMTATMAAVNSKERALQTRERIASAAGRSVRRAGLRRRTDGRHRGRGGRGGADRLLRVPHQAGAPDGRLGPGGAREPHGAAARPAGLVPAGPRRARPPGDASAHGRRRPDHPGTHRARDAGDDVGAGRGGCERRTTGARRRGTPAGARS